jgi:hypothetical protein
LVGGWRETKSYFNFVCAHTQLSPPIAAAHPGLLRLHPAAAAWDLPGLVAAWLARVAVEAGGPLDLRVEPFMKSRSGPIAEAAARFREPAWLGRR